MNEPHSNRVVLITGGGTGIGAACATTLADGGDTVVICGRRLDALELVAASTGAVPIACDVGDADAVGQLVAAIGEQFGRLDCVVLNAGTAESAPIGELTLAQWEMTIRINLTGCFSVLNAALPLLLAAEHPAVVAISSLAGLRAGPGYGAYGASKAGLNMLVQVLAVEYAGQGLRANSVCPGWIRTEMADGEMATLADEWSTDIEGAYQRVTVPVPQRRPGTAEEVAALVAWLLSTEASYVNGAVINIDGGLGAVDPGVLPFLAT